MYKKMEQDFILTCSLSYQKKLLPQHWFKFGRILQNSKGDLNTFIIALKICNMEDSNKVEFLNELITSVNKFDITDIINF